MLDEIRQPNYMTDPYRDEELDDFDGEECPDCGSILLEDGMCPVCDDEEWDH